MRREREPEDGKKEKTGRREEERKRRMVREKHPSPSSLLPVFPPSRLPVLSA